jgi:hypothetical protein
MKRLPALLPLLLVGACEARPATPAATVSLAAGIAPDDLAGRVAQFDPAVIDFADSVLAPWEKSVIQKLVAATDIVHDLYALQVSPRNPSWREQVQSLQGPGAEAIRQYFDIMVGPWDRLEHDAPFLDVGPKPEGAGFYAPDITREEFDRWVAAHPDQKEAFTGYFTVIRRSADSTLQAVPYSTAYADPLNRAAALLREAADLAQNASLAAFLRQRADAFLSDDYYASDVAWMDITGSRIEPTIGPYEVYEDALFGYKAAFESFITLADSAASAELQTLKDHLPALERQLPIDNRYKNPERGFESPIRVVDEVYTGGDARRGVQTTAFNLPNDVRVTEAKGSKKVMLRNVSQAKFDRILAPIARELLADSLAARIEFHPWFTNVVMHELAHGLGPTTVTTPTGERTSVNRALRDHYSALEEAKADVTGLHNLTVLVAQGVYDRPFLRAAFIGHIADLFRAVRFGTAEAHGRANLIQFDWLREKNALTYDEATGHFAADIDAVIAANRELAHEILTIQATGDYDRAGSFIAQYTTLRPELQAALGRLSSIPVDIRPEFRVLEKMKTW